MKIFSSLISTFSYFKQLLHEREIIKIHVAIFRLGDGETLAQISGSHGGHKGTYKRYTRDAYSLELSEKFDSEN